MPTDAPTLRVMALHALAYCERLFYLEEVEEIRVADESVWAGRTLHLDLDEPGEMVNLTLESDALGIRGRLDAVRRRDGGMYPIEHKRGRARRDAARKPAAWDTDALQAAAYAMLLEEHTGSTITEARIRYHKDNVTVRLPIDDTARTGVVRAVERARTLLQTTERPPITREERRCARCSLAPVCLPEEERFAHAEREDAKETAFPVRLYPADTDRRSLHVVSQGARVGRSGDAFEVTPRDGAAETVGAREVSDIVLHGFAQITTQALRLALNEEIPVHVATTSGVLLGSFLGADRGVQRRIRQFRGLGDETIALPLARRIVMAKVEMQLRHTLRASRKGEGELRGEVAEDVNAMRAALRRAARAGTREEMMGEEGIAAKAYFHAIATLVHPDAGDLMRPRGRSRRPPADRFNALLSFGYSLLYKDVVGAIVRVGLEPAFGILHQPRSAALPLALDLEELFRVPVVDMAVLGAVNRRTFHVDRDFAVTGKQVWLSEDGRKKLIEVYERRKHEEYRHDVLGFSVSYARLMELEARLLEKEWCENSERGLFARFRIR